MKPREWRRQVHDLADEYGGTVTRSNGGHYRIHLPGVRGPIFTSFSSSDHRAIKNLRGQIRRALRGDQP